MVIEFMVSKPGFEIGVLAEANICTNSLKKRIFIGSKFSKQSLLFCMFAAMVLWDMTMWHQFRLHVKNGFSNLTKE